MLQTQDAFKEIVAKVLWQRCGNLRLKRREKGTMDETEGEGGKEHQLAVYYCGDHA